MRARNWLKTSRIRKIKKKWDADERGLSGFSRIVLEIRVNPRPFF